MDTAFRGKSDLIWNAATEPFDTSPTCLEQECHGISIDFGTADGRPFTAKALVFASSIRQRAAIKSIQIIARHEVNSA